MVSSRQALIGSGAHGREDVVLLSQLWSGRMFWLAAPERVLRERDTQSLLDTLAAGTSMLDEMADPWVAQVMWHATLRLVELGKLGPDALDSLDRLSSLARASDEGTTYFGPIEWFGEVYLDYWETLGEFLRWRHGLRTSGGLVTRAQRLTASSDPFVASQSKLLLAQAYVAQARDGTGRRRLFAWFPSGYSNVGQRALKIVEELCELRAWSLVSHRRLQRAMRLLQQEDYVQAAHLLDPAHHLTDSSDASTSLDELRKAFERALRGKRGARAQNLGAFAAQLRDFVPSEPFPEPQQLELLDLLEEWVKECDRPRNARSATSLRVTLQRVVDHCWPPSRSRSATVAERLDTLIPPEDPRPQVAVPKKANSQAATVPVDFTPPSVSVSIPATARLSPSPPGLITVVEELIRELKKTRLSDPPASPTLARTDDWHPGLGSTWPRRLADARGQADTPEAISSALDLCLALLLDSRYLSPTGEAIVHGTIGTLVARISRGPLAPTEVLSRALETADESIRQCHTHPIPEPNLRGLCDVWEARRFIPEPTWMITNTAPFLGHPSESWGPDRPHTILHYSRTLLYQSRGHWSDHDASVFLQLDEELHKADRYLDAEYGDHILDRADMLGNVRFYRARNALRLADLTEGSARESWVQTAKECILAGAHDPDTPPEHRMHLIHEWRTCSQYSDIIGPAEDLEVAESLRDCDPVAAHPIYVAAMLRTATPEAVAQALAAIENADVAPLDTLSFLLHLEVASDAAMAYASMGLNPGIEIRDPVCEQYELWVSSEAGAEEPSILTRMAQHHLFLFNRTAEFAHLGLALDYSRRARELVDEQHLEGQEVAVAVALSLISVLTVTRSHVGIGSNEEIAELANWATDPRIVPPKHGNRAYVCCEAARFLAALPDSASRARSQTLLDEAHEGFGRTGNLAAIHVLEVDQLVREARQALDRLAVPDEELIGLQDRADRMATEEAENMPRADASQILLTLVRGALRIRRGCNPNSPAHLEAEGVALQHRAVCDFLKQVEHEQYRFLDVVAEGLQHVDRDHYPDEAAAVQKVLVKAVSVSLLGPSRMLHHGVKLLAQAAPDVAAVGGMLDWALIRAMEAMDSVSDERLVLSTLQGRCRDLALKLAELGHGALAWKWAENGSAMGLRRRLWKHPRPDMIPAGREIVVGVQVGHLLAGAKGGYALLAGKQSTPVPLPLLTDEAVSNWVACLAGDARAGGFRRLRGRASSGKVLGGDSASVMAAMREAIAPLNHLQSDPGTAVDNWVAVGQLSALPWQAAWLISEFGSNRPLPRFHPSVLGLYMSHQNEVAMAARADSWDQSQFRVVTNPNPCWRDGEVLPLLPGATSEGCHLRELLPFARVWDGLEATRSNFLSALEGDGRVLHVAVHGEASPALLGDAALFLREDCTQEEVEGIDAASSVAVVSVEEVMESTSPFALVWLGACWAGRPNEFLPDENRGLPSAFIAGSSSAVVAPLWPVDDELAREFACAFYDSWLLDGLDVGEAFRMAMLYTRELDPAGCTWPAFTLTGTFNGRASHASDHRGTP